MADYVRRGKVEFELCGGNLPEKYKAFVRRVLNDKNLVPAADVAEVVHGQWFVSKIRSIETVFYCSECMRTVTVGNDFFGEAPKSVSAAYPYCHCGAKMDGGNDNVSD